MNEPQHDSGFTAFWLRYPNRTAKKDAEKAWQKLRPSPSLQAVMFAAIEDQKAWRALPGWHPDWPYPATWLRGARWEDELPGLTAPTRIVSEDALKRAAHLRSKVYGRCPHEPRCQTYRECLEALATSPVSVETA